VSNFSYKLAVTLQWRKKKNQGITSMTFRQNKNQGITKHDEHVIEIKIKGSQQRNINQGIIKHDKHVIKI
jgi:hypothetical protein